MIPGRESSRRYIDLGMSALLILMISILVSCAPSSPTMTVKFTSALESEGALNVKENGHPKVVHLRSKGALCKGVVLTPNTVLTAAHCLPDGFDKSVRGYLDGTLIRFQGLERHPNYNPSNAIPKFDVALLRTKFPLELEGLPVIVSRGASPGEPFYAIASEAVSATSVRSTLFVRSMKVCSPKALMQSIIRDLKEPMRPEMVKGLSSLIDSNDAPMMYKIQHNFDSLLLAIHDTAQASIRAGDSGAPALAMHSDKLGVIGIASANIFSDVGESRDIPKASIFATLNHPDTLRFLTQFDPEIEIL